MNNKKDQNVSFEFEKNYKPNEQHFDLQKRREKNVKVLSELINELKSVEEKYVSAKRNAVLEVENDDNIKNKDEALDKKFDEINTRIESDKKQLKNKLKKEIIHQAKELLILKKNEDVYEFYNLIYKMPLEDEFASFEQDLYREFLMSRPKIENVIIAYSSLKDNDVNKTDFPKKTKEPVELSEDYKEANSLVEKAVNEYTKLNVERAYVSVNQLKNKEEKESLLKKLDELVLEKTKTLKDEIDSLYAKVQNIKLDINTNSLIDQYKINSLAKLFKETKDDSIPEISFDKATYGKKLNRIIEVYNMQEQNNFKSTKKEIRKNPLEKAGLISFIASAFKGIKDQKLKERIVLRYKNKISNAKDEEKINNYVNKISQVDIVSTPKLYISRQKLKKLKPVLYENGIAGLTDKEHKIYVKAVNNITDKMLGSVLKTISEANAIDDKYRVKTVIIQLLEIVSRVQDSVKITNAFGKERITYSKDQILQLAFGFIKKARDLGSISVEDYNRYNRELLDILAYRKEVDDYYEIASNTNENALETDSYYDELDNDERKYYSNPITYTDDDKTEMISYIKRRRG